MAFRDLILGRPRPARVREIDLPRRERYFPSPHDWRDEIIYFLLPDRFSDGREATRPMVDASSAAASRDAGFRFDRWAESGRERFQGGTIKGIQSKLEYLSALGVTTVWVGPVLKQRAHLDTFHGYAIQDFLDVDPRFGTRKDLVALVTAAHARGLRVILDVVFNHSGCNWLYADGRREKPYVGFPAFHAKGPWFDADGGTTGCACRRGRGRGRVAGGTAARRLLHPRRRRGLRRRSRRRARAVPPHRLLRPA